MSGADQDLIDRFIREYGVTRLPAVHTRQPSPPAARGPSKSDAPEWQKFHGGNARPQGGTVTRFVGTSHHADREQAALPATHRAITGATTMFPKSVVDAWDSERLLISGHNSAKLGRVVLVGPWKGMPIFHLTLVERETCPSSCAVWRECFGNAMPFTRRHRYSADLVERLDDELRDKAIEHPHGFVVRLHGLGDFPDVDYAREWIGWMSTIGQLRVFGYTAHPAASEIGSVINLAGALFPERWAMRFSVPADDDPAPMQATTIWRQPEGPQVPEGTVCPAQRGKTQACATCGLCWWPPAQSRRIVFIGHGMRSRRPSA